LVTGAAFAAAMLCPSLASAEAAQFFAVLNGANEISPSGAANAGDPNGFGTATVMIPSSGTVCFGMTVTLVSKPTLAHIHSGKAGVNGPIVIPLTPPQQGNPGASSGCLTDVDKTLLNQIRANPQAFYVNVHTGQFPGGAVRGQLF
jgi:hypothetical protein